MADDERNEAQQTQDEREGGLPPVREQVGALREEFAPARVNRKLEEVAEERPKMRRLVDFSIVGKALLAAVVVALILWLIAGAQFAAIALVVVFVGGWLLGAQLSYDRRRETTDARADDEEEEEDDSDEREREGGEGKKADEVKDEQPREAEQRSPGDREDFEGDRGEAEAKQEQESSGSSNGTDPERQRARD